MFRFLTSRGLAAAGEALATLAVAVLLLAAASIALSPSDPPTEDGYGMGYALDTPATSLGLPGVPANPELTSSTPHDVAAELRAAGWRQTDKFVMHDAAEPTRVTGRGSTFKKVESGATIWVQLLDRLSEGSGVDVGTMRIRFVTVSLGSSDYTSVTCPPDNAYDVSGAILKTRLMGQSVVKGEFGVSSTGRAGECYLN